MTQPNLPEPKAASSKASFVWWQVQNLKVFSVRSHEKGVEQLILTFESPGQCWSVSQFKAVETETFQ